VSYAILPKIKQAIEIAHFAYVLNLMPYGKSNFSTARVRAREVTGIPTTNALKSPLGSL
jgi:hypothetical protein